MTPSARTPGGGSIPATRLVFLVAGLGVSAWAPLVPYAQERLALEPGLLGPLLLCLGVGSILAMPITGGLAGRLGCRRVILWAGVGLVAVLPALALAGSVLSLALALFVFGAAVGTIDVAMNIQAVIVERTAGRPLMSGFHGLFSLGGILGAGGVTLLLGQGASPLEACLAVAALVTLLLGLSRSGLLTHGGEEEGGEGRTPLFVAPRGPVLVIGILCFVCFLAEGAILDWSALFLTLVRGLDPSAGGWGYAVFALAMTLGRLTGDRVVATLGGKRVLLGGGLCAAAGFLLPVLVASPALSLVGFALLGLGAANIVPVLFTAAGRQGSMPANRAVAAITTLGYAGILAGPALIGGVVALSSLSLAFTLLALLMALVPLSARRVMAGA